MPDRIAAGGILRSMTDLKRSQINSHQCSRSRRRHRPTQAILPGLEVACSVDLPMLQEGTTNKQRAWCLWRYEKPYEKNQYLRNSHSVDCSSGWTMESSRTARRTWRCDEGWCRTSIAGIVPQPTNWLTKLSTA